MRGISIATLVFLYAPIAALLLFSFNASPLITVWEGFDPKWYGVALANADLMRAALNSLIVGFFTTIFATAIALSTALALHKKKNPAASRLMTLPLLMPEIVIAVATLAFFSAIKLDLGLINVLLAHIAFCVPFAYTPIAARLKTIPAAVAEAASDLYATPQQTFFRVTLPLLAPGIASGAMLAFITSLDDFIITQMVAPPGAQTLPVYIYSMVRRGITPEINAASSILLLLSIALVLISHQINRRKIS